MLGGIADILFPPRCQACHVIRHDRTNRPFCDACTSRILMIEPPLCPACGLPFPGTDSANHLCGECITAPRAFSTARAVGYYESTLLEAIHDFKYRGNIALGPILGGIMADHDYPSFSISACSLVMPVPLHTTRLRERGFNQSLILAKIIAQRHFIPLDFRSLSRHIHTEPQITLKKAQRQSNVKGAFQLKRAEKITGEKILLIDDVYTTGSTLNECARLLMKHGAAEVAVLTLARAV